MKKAIKPVLITLFSGVSGMKNIIPAASRVQAMLGKVARRRDLRPTDQSALVPIDEEI